MMRTLKAISGGNMRRHILTIALIGAALLAADASRAQTAAPNPLDAVPDKMPFDVPYGAPISLERAQAVYHSWSSPMFRASWRFGNVAVPIGGVANMG